MNIGERIKKRRQQLGMTVDDVAAELGKNRATIYRYENDEIKELPITVLEPLAKVLKTTPADLLGWYKAQDGNSFQTESDRLFVNRAFFLQCLRDIGWEMAEPISESDMYLFSKGAITIKLSADEYSDLRAKIENAGSSIIQDNFSSILHSNLLPIAAHAKDGATPEDQMEDAELLEKYADAEEDDAD